MNRHTRRLGLSATLATALAMGALGATSAPAAPAGPAPAAGGPTAAPTQGPQDHELSDATARRLVAGLALPAQSRAPGRAAVETVQQHGAAFGLAGADLDLRVADTTTESGQVTVRLAQRHHGLPVLGAEYNVRMRHEGGDLVTTGASGSLFTELDATPAPTASLDAARAVARHSLTPQQWAGVTHVEDHGGVVLPFGRGVITRHITLEGFDPVRNVPLRQEVFVAAGRSTPVLSYNAIQLDGAVETTGEGFHGPDLPLSLVQGEGTYEFWDTTRTAQGGPDIQTYDADGADYGQFTVGELPDTVDLEASPVIPVPAEVNRYGAVDAHWGAGQVEDFYRALGRNSLDGAGGTIQSVVGVTAQGRPFANAFWNGHYMTYGTGGYGYLPFSASLDVVGHEMTHGVIEHTSGLIYLGQSGAVNEAFADYFGNAIENTSLQTATGPQDGLLGEDLCSDIEPVDCALRDLNGPATVLDFYRGVGDNGGVHSNSSIVSGALWDIRQELGATFADPLVYEVMTTYLTPWSQFVDVRESVLAAATQQGATRQQLAVITTAFADRGIVPGWQESLGGLDSQVLYRPVMVATTPSVSGDRFALESYDFELGRGAILVGNAARGAVERIASPEPVVDYELPATDGRTVAWASTDYSTTPFQVALHTRRFNGGAESTLAELGTAYLWSLDFDGRTAAWTAARPDWRDMVVVRLADGRQVQMPDHPGMEQSDPVISGRYVVYAEYSYNSAPGEQAYLRRYDTRTGAVSTLATVQGNEESTAHVFRPQVMDGQVYFAAEQDYRLATGLWRVPLEGGPVTVLVTERGGDGVFVNQLTVGEGQVTWENLQSWDDPTQVLSMDVREGRVQRVSCSVGEQQRPFPGKHGRVSWVDTTTATPSLVTRATPRGTCP